MVVTPPKVWYTERKLSKNQGGGNMDENLRSIVNPDADKLEQVINTKLLWNLTTRQELSFTDTLDWKHVRHLSVIHTKNNGFFAGLAGKLIKGCYVDPTGRWVLLADDHDEHIQAYLDRCPAELESLYIGFTALTGLTLSACTSLRELYLTNNQELAQVHGLPRLSALQILNLHDTKVTRLDLSASVTLRILRLHHNHDLAELNGLSRLRSLKTLSLNNTKLQELTLPASHSLQNLDLSFNNELTEINGLSSQASLRTLSLYGCQCEFVLDLTPMPRLHQLNLFRSQFSGIRLDRVSWELQYCYIYAITSCGLEFLENCPGMRVLHLSSCSISRIPEGVRSMKQLQRLNLFDLTLAELPYWLPELGLDIGTKSSNAIRLDGTTVENVNMSIFTRSQEMIRDWFDAQKEAREGKPLNEIKVVFLGDGSTGKSLTVARLLKNGALPSNFNGDATPGIAIEDRSYDLPDGRNVQVHFWDFGGQEILHSMHRIFLTDRTLYVVMINARNNTQDDQARYWLHNVSSFAPGCPVLLVLNQIDQNPNASVNERSLKRLYPNLQQVIRLSALNFDQKTFNREFTNKMLEQIASFSSLGTIFPPTWKKVMDKIRAMDGNYIRGGEYNRICKESGVDGHRLRLDLLKWFNDIGVSFCCGKSARLRDYVVLRPEWITNAIYTIIWNKRSDTANGMVDQEEIYHLLSPENRDGVKQVRSDMTYKQEDVTYVLDLTRQFRLSFLMDNGKEFIPMLCNANALPEADEFLDDPCVTEFRMEYEYLPDNVLHRLMVDMRQDLRTDKVWYTGALLRQKYNGIDALVKSEGNVLSIYIRAADADHKAHTYLNTLRCTLEAIHTDMGLKPPKMLVAYTEDGQTEYFSYNKLEGARKNGVLMEYSEVFDKSIPIADILNGTDSQVAQAKEKLLQDIAKACVQLQQNRLMFGAKEDDRNDTLRNALINIGYRVADQTHTGTGRTGKRAGSLDLQLQHADGSVWTNLEAMNLHSDSKTQMAYWDDHLNRLMINYNGAGLPTLFLISYVDCAVDHFHRLHGAYIDHMKEYAPPKSELRHGTLTEVAFRDGQYACLKADRCTYDLRGTPVMVYHYFVGFPTAPGDLRTEFEN